MVFLWLAMLAVLGCGQRGDDGKLKVGYVANYISREWCQNICKAARQRATEMGVDLIIADANLDVATQISKAENLIGQGVKVLILTPVDARTLDVLVRQAKEAGLYVITESNPVPGSDTYVGIDNKESGRKAGRWFAEYAKAGQLDPHILIIGLPNSEDCRLRVEGFKEALAESGIPSQIIQEVDGQGLKEKAFKAAQEVFTAHPEVNVIFGINDDSTTGGIAAYQAAGLNQAELTAIGFGLEGIVGQTALLSHTPYKAALAMFPNFVGLSLVEAAVALGRGEVLPPHYETPTTMITLDNFNAFYRQEGQGKVMDFDAIRRLLSAP